MRKIVVDDVDMTNVRASFDAFVTTLRAGARVDITRDVHVSFTRFYASIVHDRDDVPHVRVARATFTIDDVHHNAYARINVRTGRIDRARWAIESYRPYNA